MARSPLERPSARRLIQAGFLTLFLVLFLFVSRPALHVQGRQSVPARFFLVLDPLVSISAAIAARAWIASLVGAGVILAVCLLVPRGFCGYACPLGTLIDVFDRVVGRRVSALHIKRRGWWVHLKYYALTAVLAASLFGVGLAGFVSAIPVVTRGLAYTLGSLEMGALEGWGHVPRPRGGYYVSIVLFAAVLGLGLLRPRFWCRYVCPTGALFSVVGSLRLTERKVAPSCVECGQCVSVCPFDAINPDYSTRPRDCTFCRACERECPVDAIRFTWRWQVGEARPATEPVPDAVPLSRRGFLGGAIAGVGGVLGLRRLPPGPPGIAVRPPGSVPEELFVARCVRCGQCINACTTGILQPAGTRFGLESLWTPYAEANRAGCASACNNCGQVCPTGAIRALPIEEKRAARMGRAIVQDNCNLCGRCFEACPHGAITWVGEPLVSASKCVGCGTCQAACYAFNVAGTRALDRPAIVVTADGGLDDRISTGSYIELRKREPKEMIPEEEQPELQFDVPDFPGGL